MVEGVQPATTWLCDSRKVLCNENICIERGSQARARVQTYFTGLKPWDALRQVLASSGLPLQPLLLQPPGPAPRTFPVVCAQALGGP